MIKDLYSYRVRESGLAETRVSSPGMCIYCGKFGLKLQDEHIIAAGLGGNLVLEKSSCSSCAKITGRIERHVLQEMLGFLRGNQGISSNRRAPIRTMRINDRPRVPIEGTPADIEFSENTPYAIPMFITNDYPSILKGVVGGGPYPPQRPIPYVINPANWHEMLKKFPHDGEAVSFGMKVDLRLFARMIAKIAHSFAVCELGTNFIPTLKKYIISSEDLAIDTRFIGSVKTEASLSLHDLQMYNAISGNSQDKNVYWICNVRIFSHMETPTFRVVVGTRSLY